MADGPTAGLVVRYREVYRFVRRRTPNAAEAEELTQQVFVDAAAAQPSGFSVGDGLNDA
jgi:DNA-directed RNA polymerase specialized sigma24 family protein